MGRVLSGWVWSGHGFYKDPRPVGSSPIFENIIYFEGHLVNNSGSGRVRILLLTTGRVGSSFLWIGSDEENRSMRNSAEHPLPKGIEHLLLHIPIRIILHFI